MDPYTNRVIRWISGVRERLRKPWAWGALVALFIWFAVRLFAEEQLVAAGRYVVPYLRDLSRQPIGAFGLLCLGGIAVTIIVVLVLAWWDTSPKLDVLRKRKRRIPEYELRAIMDIRALWSRHGANAVSEMRVLSEIILGDLRNKVYWASCLSNMLTVYHEAERAIDAGLTPDKSIGLREVQDLFNNVYGSYLNACSWLAKLDKHGDVDLTDRSYHRRLLEWQQSHATFYDRTLQLIHADSGRQRGLKVELHPLVRFDEPEVVAFMYAAERQLGWPITASGPAINDDAPADAPSSA